MNIVESCASSRLSTSILTVIPLYASAAVAMLAETVGAATDAPRFSASRSMSASPSRKKCRFRGSRTSRGSGPVEVQDGLAGEDVEARLERVDVAIDVAVRELGEREPGVDGAGVAADQQ